MQTILQGVHWTMLERVLIGASISVATICLLLGKTTAALYTAIIGGFALLWVACTGSPRKACMGRLNSTTGQMKVRWW